jgi:hypothetical protein
MHRELEWPVSKATCLYKKLYMVYSFLYTIIEGTRSRWRQRQAVVRVVVALRFGHASRAVKR